ncbi:MAG TPA: YfcE family phosphodiesterase [Pseudomonadales bacterium]|nr:YfcE family phosphodiesterase [Pseudomonadales bacterium]
MKIGLIADTHMPGSIRELWPQVFEAFRDADCILHAGDLHTLDIVDRLSEIAPTYVAAGNGDVGLVDDRLQHTWLLEHSGVHIGMIHQFPSPQRRSYEQLENYMCRHFGDALPHVMVFGHTHKESIHHVNNLLCINPGSPTLPQNQSLRHGTIGTLEIEADALCASIWQIHDEGVSQHAEIAPLRVQLAHPR